MNAWLADFKKEFVLNFIDDNRWTWLLEGLGNTLKITVLALALGIVIGIVIASITSTYDKNKEDYARQGGLKNVLFKFFNGICQIYLTIIRGTPVLVQLMIIYYVVFATSNNSIPVAGLAFGINSGAYVAEIFRGGILAIDNGQFEAGRSVGFNYIQTMWYIVIPQMFKVVLPTLVNEFIVLVKETSVAGYVGIRDLTKAGDLIRGRTFSAFMPLFAVALIYLAIVMIFSFFAKRLERRLRSNDR